MKFKSWFKGVALFAALTTFGATTASCAYVLHPERRNSGRTSGRLDTVPLVLDILWFLPGIIPGVIALIVDFTTGAIYVQNFGDAPLKATGKVAVKLPPTGGATAVTLKLLTADGRLLDQAAARPGDGADKLTVDVAKGVTVAKRLGADSRQLQLEVSGMTDAPVRIPVVTR